VTFGVYVNNQQNINRKILATVLEGLLEQASAALACKFVGRLLVYD
jgi:hypothetical protein